MTHTINTDRTAAVATDVYWQPITPETPIGVRVMLINRRAGVTTVGFVRSNEPFFTHWAPLPKWRTE